VSETGFGEETIGVGQRDGVLGELHGVQPVPNVLDLCGGEEEACLKVLEGASEELNSLYAVPVERVVGVYEGILCEDGPEGTAIEGIGERLMPALLCEIHCV
jgi:hypothetical protein